MAATGTVKWFNIQKGFGFIQPEGGGKDVFVWVLCSSRSRPAGGGSSPEAALQRPAVRGG